MKNTWVLKKHHPDVTKLCSFFCTLLLMKSISATAQSAYTQSKIAVDQQHANCLINGYVLATTTNLNDIRKNVNIVRHCFYAIIVVYHFNACRYVTPRCCCLFDLILYAPVSNLSVMFGWVFLCWNSTDAPVICIPAPRGQGKSRLFNFSIFKALLKALHCGVNL